MDINFNVFLEREFGASNNKVKTQEMINKEVAAGKNRRDVALVVDASGRDVEGITDRKIESFFNETVSMLGFNFDSLTKMDRVFSALSKGGYRPSPATIAKVIEVQQTARDIGKNATATKEACANFLGYASVNVNWEKQAKEIVDFHNTRNEYANKTIRGVLADLQLIEDKKDKGLIAAPKTQRKLYFDDFYKAKVPAGVIKLYQKSKDEIEKERRLYNSYHNYGAKISPYSIIKADGTKCDITDIPVKTMLATGLSTLAMGDKNEIQKLRIICQNLNKDSFHPTYEEVAFLAKMDHDFLNIQKTDPNVAKIFRSLRSLADDKFQQARHIAMHRCGVNGKKATYDDILNTLGDLSEMEKAKAKATDKEKDDSYGGGK